MSDPSSAKPKSGFGAFSAQIRDLEQLLLAPDDVRWIERHARPDRPVELLLYLGCNILRTAHLAVEAVDVFRALGVDVVAVAGPQFCCGTVHHKEGNVESGVALGKASSAKMLSYGAAQVAMWCPTCYMRFDQLAQDGSIAPLPMVSAVEYLADRIDRFPPLKAVQGRVALHGHTGEPQRDADATAARKLLSAVPGVEVVGALASPDFDYQCPTALAKLGRQGFRQGQAEMIEEARRLGADTIVTLYHSCHRLWSDVDAGGLPVRNYVSVLAETLGCARPDYYQQFTRLRDASAIVELSRRMWESKGLSEAEARTVTAKRFAVDETEK